jgi:hypothetical protein
MKNYNVIIMYIVYLGIWGNLGYFFTNLKTGLSRQSFGGACAHDRGSFQQAWLTLSYRSS